MDKSDQDDIYKQALTDIVAPIFDDNIEMVDKFLHICEAAKKHAFTIASLNLKINQSRK